MRASALSRVRRDTFCCNHLPPSGYPFRPTSISPHLEGCTNRVMSPTGQPSSTVTYAYTLRPKGKLVPPVAKASSSYTVTPAKAGEITFSSAPKLKKPKTVTKNGIASQKKHCIALPRADASAKRSSSIRRVLCRHCWTQRFWSVAPLCRRRRDDRYISFTVSNTQ